MDSSQNAAAFIRKLAEMAYRLAARDIVVASLKADWAGFGSWELHTERGAERDSYGQLIMKAVRNEELTLDDPKLDIGPEVVRVLWDGHDGILYVETSPTGFCSAPVKWKPECSKAFDHNKDELFQFVEDYLIKRLAPERPAK